MHTAHRFENTATNTFWNHSGRNSRIINGLETRDCAYVWFSVSIRCSGGRQAEYEPDVGRETNNDILFEPSAPLNPHRFPDTFYFSRFQAVGFANVTNITHPGYDMKTHVDNIRGATSLCVYEIWFYFRIERITIVIIIIIWRGVFLSIFFLFVSYLETKRKTWT